MEEKLHTQHNEVQEELQSLSPILGNIRKAHLSEQDNTYRSERLRASILNVLEEERKASGVVLKSVGGNHLSQKSRFRLAPAWAAAIVTVLGCWFMFQYNQTEKNTSAVVADITTEEAVRYIQQNVNEFDAEQLYELGGEKATSKSLDNFSQEEVLDYLEHHIDEFDTISDENDL